MLAYIFIEVRTGTLRRIVMNVYGQLFYEYDCSFLGLEVALVPNKFLVSGASVNLVVLVIATLQQFNLPMAGRAIISHNQYENVAIPVYLQ